MTTKDQTLQKIVRLLKREFNPSRLVVPRFKGDRMAVWEKCNELILNKFGVLTDVFTYSKTEFKKAVGEFSSIPETAVTTGKEIDLGTV